MHPLVASSRETVSDSLDSYVRVLSRVFSFREIAWRPCSYRENLGRTRSRPAGLSMTQFLPPPGNYYEWFFAEFSQRYLERAATSS